MHLVSICFQATDASEDTNSFIQVLWMGARRWIEAASRVKSRQPVTYNADYGSYIVL